MQRGYPITIYVAKRKQWFIQPPNLVKKEFMKTHKKALCIYGINNRDDNKKLMNTIKEITALILSKKR